MHSIWLFVKDYRLHNALLKYSVKLPRCLEASLFAAVVIEHFNKPGVGKLRPADRYIAALERSYF